MTIARLAPVLVLLGAPLALMPTLGCSSYGGAAPGRFGGFGATQGGVQDLGLARELVSEGTVPPAAAFVVEGMFSEHDLPVEGAPCARTFCVRGAGAVAPDASGTTRGWVQLGLSSTIDPQQYERPHTTLIATVDVSGSMGWGGNTDNPGEISRSLLHALVDQLDEGDQLAIVTYGSSVEVPVALAPVSAASLHHVIDGLHENGSTNMEAGLRRSFEIAQGARAADPGRNVRVLLFTDEQPNVGATTPEAFGGMVASAASHDIGITVFGAGHGLGQDIFVAMSHLRGGNAFSLFEHDDVATLMDESWPWMLAPVAFDLHVAAMTSAELEVSHTYGFPDATASAEPVLDASTVFLSQRRGALLIELAGTDAAALPAGGSVALALSYDEPSGEHVEETVEVTLPSTSDDAPAHYAQSATHSTIALALLVDGMREAATEYATSHAAGTAVMQTTRDRFAADVASSSDTSLTTELDFADDLLGLMQSGAGQREY